MLQIKRILLPCMLITIVLIYSACIHKSSNPSKTWFYNEEFDGWPFFEQLNGKIKRISINYSPGNTSDYNIIDFDEQGNMESSKMESIDIALSNGTPDTTIHKTSSVYKIIYSNNQVIGLIQILSDSHNFLQDVSLSGNYSDTVLLKYNSIRKLVKSDTITYPNQHREADIFTFRYDSNKCVIESNLFEPNRALPLYKNTYTYLNFDSNGNWGKIIRHHQSYPPLERRTFIDTIIRKITYY